MQEKDVLVHKNFYVLLIIMELLYVAKKTHLLTIATLKMEIQINAQIQMEQVVN